MRSSNYVVDRGRYDTIDGDPVIRTIYDQANLDADLSLTAVRAVTDAVSPMQAASYIMTVGLEDVRIIAIGSRWFGLGATRAHNPVGRCEMAVVELIDGGFERLRLPASPHPDRHEKNWMPFVVDGQLLVVYSCGPTVVLHCDVESGQMRPVSTREASPTLADERGGSQGIAVEDGFRFITHHVDWETGQRVYRHRFVVLDPDHQIVAASPPFRFLTTGVEFCAGLARHGDQLLLSFGVGDRDAYLARVAYQDVRSRLEPV